jgi:hypothetical protein
MEPPGTYSKKMLRASSVRSVPCAPQHSQHAAGGPWVSAAAAARPAAQPHRKPACTRPTRTRPTQAPGTAPPLSSLFPHTRRRAPRWPQADAGSLPPLSPLSILVQPPTPGSHQVAHDVWVAQPLQQPHLRLQLPHVLRDLAALRRRRPDVDLLHRHQLPCVIVHPQVHAAKGALADQLAARPVGGRRAVRRVEAGEVRRAAARRAAAVHGRRRGLAGRWLGACSAHQMLGCRVRVRLG